MASEDEEFTTLFQDFYPSLCRFLECLLDGRAALAQDLAQESFLQLHRTAWSKLPPGEARFWLYRVARNFAINEFRRGQTRSRLFEHLVKVMRPRRRNPEEEYEAQEAAADGAGDATESTRRSAHGAAVARTGAIELSRDRTRAEHFGKQGEDRHFSGSHDFTRNLVQAKSSFKRTRTLKVILWVAIKLKRFPC